MDAKSADEAKLRAAFKADPKNAGASDPWDEIAQAIKVQQSIFPELTYLERLRGFSRHLAQSARNLVRAAAEKPKPNQERMREFRDSNLPSFEQQLFSTEPIYKNLEVALLADSLSEMQDSLGKDNSDVQKVLQGKTPAEAAKDLITNTKLDDLAVRKQLYEGGQAAIDASNDPLIVAMRAIDPSARTARKQFEDQVDAVVRRDGTTVAKARFAQSGFAQPPDATFTLRLSYGAVKGYQENGKSIPFATNIGGAFEHAAEHNNQSPYNLPESWMKSKTNLDLKTPLNFVSTADIIGGNSGSPTVNKKGRGCWNHFRRQYPIAYRGTSLSVTFRDAPYPSTREAFKKLCARYTAQPLWRMNSWAQKRRERRLASKSRNLVTLTPVDDELASGRPHH